MFLYYRFNCEKQENMEYAIWFWDSRIFVAFTRWCHLTERVQDFSHNLTSTLKNKLWESFGSMSEFSVFFLTSTSSSCCNLISKTVELSTHLNRKRPCSSWVSPLTVKAKCARKKSFFGKTCPRKFWGIWTISLRDANLWKIKSLTAKGFELVYLLLLSFHKLSRIGRVKVG